MRAELLLHTEHDCTQAHYTVTDHIFPALTRSSYISSPSRTVSFQCAGGEQNLVGCVRASGVHLPPARTVSHLSTGVYLFTHQSP